MLKGVPKCLSPDLLHALRSMGHGDEIVIADGNFPAASNAKRLIRADGLGVLEVLRAVVKYLPLDQYVMDNVCVMQGTRTRGEPATSIVVDMRQHEAHVACLRHTSRTWRYQLARSPADLERFRGTFMPSYARWTSSCCLHHVIAMLMNSTCCWSQSTIKVEEEGFAGLTEIERHDFYERARSAYAVVATSETAIYANIILKKVRRSRWHISLPLPLSLSLSIMRD